MQDSICHQLADEQLHKIDCVAFIPFDENVADELSRRRSAPRVRRQDDAAQRPRPPACATLGRCAMGPSLELSGRLPAPSAPSQVAWRENHAITTAYGGAVHPARCNSPLALSAHRHDRLRRCAWACTSTRSCRGWRGRSWTDTSTVLARRGPCRLGQKCTLPSLRPRRIDGRDGLRQAAGT